MTKLHPIGRLNGFFYSKLGEIFEREFREVYLRAKNLEFKVLERGSVLVKREMPTASATS